MEPLQPFLFVVSQTIVGENCKSFNQWWNGLNHGVHRTLFFCSWFLLFLILWATIFDLKWYDFTSDSHCWSSHFEIEDIYCTRLNKIKGLVWYLLLNKLPGYHTDIIVIIPVLWVFYIPYNYVGAKS